MTKKLCATVQRCTPSRVLCALLLAFSVFLFSACGAAAPSPRSDPAQQVAAEGESDTQLQVITTIFPQSDFVRAIAGDRASVTMLLQPGVESHSYEPTPKDILTIQDADLFICVGGASESWVDRVLDSLDTENMTVLRMMDYADLAPEEFVEGMQADQDHDHPAEAEDGHDHSNQGGEGPDPDDDIYDEHVWTSPKNAMAIVEGIADVLSTLDPQGAAIYQDNATAYLAQLEQLDADFHAVVAEGRLDTLVFADRFPFFYFAKAYGLSYYAAFPGCATETEPSVSTVAFLIDKIKAENIPYVLHIEFSNERMADTLVESTGAGKLLFHSCHNVSKEDIENGVTYLSLMQENLSALKLALG